MKFCDLYIFLLKILIISEIKSIFYPNHLLYSVCYFSSPEAQSDSEVSSRSGAVTGGDRDYNSDSEFEIRNRPSASHGEFEVRAVPENGSWMLVRA
ncbi:hypothetical protein DPMN_181024 [Dreissena polymorpha]|uniref:Uncharacterized protein n=1 Tax=Dreissena polymorpha TaxID=45954 RepID=A0A9D4DDM9_DREPO|nr:hypothetical protein DPMN_181024 [Dreissena polymorpha]